MCYFYIFVIALAELYFVARHFDDRSIIKHVGRIVLAVCGFYNLGTEYLRVLDNLDVLPIKCVILVLFCYPNCVDRIKDRHRGTGLANKIGSAS